MASSGNIPAHPEEDESGIDQSLDEIIDGNADGNGADRGNETCRDFQRGYCPRGDRCWFKHVASENQPQDSDLAAPGIIANLGGRSLCRDYIRGHCRRGVECPYFHVTGGERCRDFDRLQECRRGIFCPFIHVSIQARSPVQSGAQHPGKPSFPFEREGYERALPNNNQQLSNQFFRGAEGGSRRQEDPYARPAPFVKTELCRDWSRFEGDCPRGASCQYLHGNPGDACRDFSRRGRCFRGDSCPFSHQVPPPESKPEICMKFLKGECNRGQNCLYSHAAHREARGQEVCKKFLRGECLRGANCNYSHPQEFSTTVFN